MTDSTTVSVVIPVKNRPELIQETLRSVQVQTYPNWEAVVVDDQSTDDTREVVATMGADDERIRLLRRPDGTGGAPVCRNTGWRNARGEYIVFLDSDDLLAEHCLERRVQHMESHPDLDFAVFGARLFDDVPGDKDQIFNVPTNEDPLDRFLKLDLPWQTAGPIYRRSAVEQVGGWNEGLSCGQDVDYGVRSLCHDLRYRHTERIDYYMRVSPSDRETLGDGPWSRERLPGRQKRVEATYRALAETGNLTEDRKLRVAGNFLHLAECWAEKGELDRARIAWRSCRRLDLVPWGISFLTDWYLKSHSTLWARYMAYYMCKHYPSELFVAADFLIGRDPKEEAKPVKDLPLQDPRNPYHRHAFILLNGPLGYTIRRLVSYLGLTSSVRFLKKALRL
jgi:glycosyltransferase involved in cell wall biosynthesis